MKTALPLISFVVLALGGGTALFFYHQNLPQVAALDAQMGEHLLAFEALDSTVNELALRSRFHIDQNYDNLARTSALLDQRVEAVEESTLNRDGLSESAVYRAFSELRSELETKKDLVENFKSHNSVLRNSLRYAPAAGEQLITIAEDIGNTDAADLYRSLLRYLLEFSLLDTSSSSESLKLLLPQLEAVEQSMPDYATTTAIEFTRHIRTVLAEEDVTDAYLQRLLTTTTDSRLETLNRSWSDWVVGQHEATRQFNLWLASYIAVLLIGVVIIAWRLRALYRTLDHEVAVQTAEVKAAYDELKASEAQLIQTEKMASLGQMVAGVAHEINTPLGYVSSNVDTVRLNMGELDRILSGVSLMAREFSKPSPDGKRVGAIVRKVVNEYQGLRKKDTISEIRELLQDSSYGLKEITDLVGSLKDFSRLDRDQTTRTDLHAGIHATLKICSNVIGTRTVHREFEDETLDIECVPAQINQVLLNVLTNAAQATGDAGNIHIRTRKLNGHVEIEVQDDGHGMTRETKDHIFDPFFTTKEIGKGTGLGMAIAYKIVKSHGGDIEVESVAGEGTTIRVRLPQSQAAPDLKVVNSGA